MTLFFSLPISLAVLIYALGRLDGMLAQAHTEKEKGR